MAARDIALMNAVYPDVPAVVLPVDGGGTARFTEVSDTTATAADVLSPKTFYKADGTKGTGSIVTKTSSDLTASGDTVTVPAGYYGSQSTKSVASGTAGTPTATKGTVSNHKIYITPSVTNTAGYISGGTKTGSSVAVDVSELEYGTKTIISSGTGISVSGYSAVDVLTGFIVKISYNSTSEKWEPDKTYSEIMAAQSQGQHIYTTTDENYQEVTAQGQITSLDNVLYFDYNVRVYNFESDPATTTETIYRMSSSNITVVNTRDFIIPSGSTTITQNGNNIDVTNLSSVNVNVSGGGSGGIVISDTTDAAGGTVRTITGVQISGTKSITQNGTGIDVAEYQYVDVAVPSSSPNLQAKTNIAPSTSSQTIQADSGYDGLSSVQINAMPSGTAGTPTATKGTVSNHQVSVTPSVTNQTGYITGSTKTGTAVTVTASELASGNKEITANGTNIDVVGYSTVSVAVPSGSSKALYTYLGLASRTANSYGATNAKVTVAKAGTYNISYVAIRGSSSGTMGTNLHIGNTEKGNQQTWNNGTYGQYVTYSNQSISANTDVTIYATSGNNSRTIYVGQLIVEEV